ncbi:MAG: hypothetical protein ACKESC_01435 [Candidatus Hodgkinia cicadicola]
MDTQIHKFKLKYYGIIKHIRGISDIFKLNLNSKKIHIPEVRNTNTFYSN